MKNKCTRIHGPTNLLFQVFPPVFLSFPSSGLSVLVNSDLTKEWIYLELFESRVPENSPWDILDSQQLLAKL
jgi:hypothetical protein